MAKKLETEKKWLIGKKTPYRSRLLAGDKILFYQGGEEGRKIVGLAELASSLQQTERSEDFVIIKNFKLWDNPVEIRVLLGELSFIRNERHWGAYFQGGVVRISEEDYRKILKAGKLD